jgi:hypothetical protein
VGAAQLIGAELWNFVGRTKLITFLIDLFDSRSVRHITAIHNVVISTP